MPKKVALFDVCFTLVSITTIPDFTEHFFLAPGTNPAFKFSKKLYHMGCKLLRKTGLMNARSYQRHFVKLFAGYGPADLGPVIEAYLVRMRKKIKPEMLQRIEYLRQEGYEIVLVSAGLDLYLQPFAKAIQAELVCTELEQENGRYTGRMNGPFCFGEAKVVKLKRRFDADTIDWAQSIAFGDEVDDVPMMQLVGTAVAVDPYPELERVARQRRWVIEKTETGNHADGPRSRLSKWDKARRLGIINLVIGGIKKLAGGLLWAIYHFDGWHAMRPLETTHYKKIAIQIANTVSNNDATIVDIGCGIGDILRRVHGKHKYGIDTDDRVIRAARLLEKFSRVPAVYTVGSVPQAAIISEPVIDVLIMTNWFHLVSDEWIEMSVRNLFQTKHVRYVLVDELGRERGRIESLFKKFGTVIADEHDWQDDKRFLLFSIR